MDIECQTGSSVARFPGCCERRGKYLVYRIPEFRLGIGPVMSLKTLALCSDEKIVRVLRRVLGDLDIAVELCADSDTALRKLTRQRFEAIVVDITDEGASDVLRSARSAPCNKQAVAVAMAEPGIGLKTVFGIG